MPGPRSRVERAAAEDLEESIDHLLRQSRQVAVEFVVACHETFELIEHPRIGRVYENQDDRFAEIRLFPVKRFSRWLVFYRILGRKFI